MSDILLKIKNSFQQAFDIDPEQITIDTTPEDILDWDSLGHVSLTNTLEREFGITFSVDDLMDMEDVRSIVKVINEKLKK